MNNWHKIFKNQLWHLLSLLGLIVGICLLLSFDSGMLNGTFGQIPANIWFGLALAAPVIHQVYVWIIWRLELYQRTFSRRFGLKKAFRLYSAGFSVLFAGRMITIIPLAMSTQNTWEVSPWFAYGAALIIFPAVVYLFVSVKRYFSFERAYGIDHFDPGYKKSFEKKGLFKYTNNAMYWVGMLALYLPGLILLSRAALIAALFNHAYIWVHYFCTERPDMTEIYGKAP